MMKKDRSVLIQGIRDGLPIGAGYFAVSFSLGIIAKNSGITVGQGFFASLLTRASAGEYGSYLLIGAGATYLELIMLCVIANMRYLLMGTAFVQKFNPSTPLWKRILASTCITDEVFAISIKYKGYLPPSYTIGAMISAGIMWAMGTACGISAGGAMPPAVVSALGVALYGMFIAIVTEPSKKDRAVALAVIASCILSCIFDYVPALSSISYGIKVVLLTALVSSAAAIIKPVKDEE